jgi:hypothetical protein
MNIATATYITFNMTSLRVFKQSLGVCSQCVRQQTTQRRTFATSSFKQSGSSHLPRVANPSLWRSLVPKALRRDGQNASDPTQPKSKAWNPATIFIVLGILVGSNAINILALRREMLNFSRKTEAKLAILRDVLKRVKDGEDVDVEKLLGTGNPDQEKDWEAKVAAREVAKAAEQDAVAKERSEGGSDGKGGRPRFMM